MFYQRNLICYYWSLDSNSW